ATRRADQGLGLAQDHPVPGGRVERLAAVGGAGGGSLPCVARLGIQCARPYASPARPCLKAAARTWTGVGGVKRHVPPPAGAVILVPAGTPGQVRWSGGFDWFHIYLEPALVERVAAEAFDLDPKRVVVPPLANLQLPPLRATMEAVNAELTTGGARGPRQGRRRSHIPAMRRRQRQPAARRRDRSPGHRTTERGQVRAAPPRYRCCRLPRREDGGHRHEG